MGDLPEIDKSQHRPIKRCNDCDAPMPDDCSASTGICAGYPYSTASYPMGYCLVTTGWSPSIGGCCRRTEVRKCCR